MKYSPVQNYIGGKFVPASSERTLPVISPLDGTQLSTVPLSTAKDLDEAVKAAKTAFPAWSKMPIKERVQVFFRYKYLLEKQIEKYPEEFSYMRPFIHVIDLYLATEKKKFLARVKNRLKRLYNR